MRALSSCLVCMAVMLLAGCSDSLGTLPASTGRPYEILIVGDDDGRLGREFEQDVPGLPQSEPLFDVIQADSAKLSSLERLARNIIVFGVSRGLDSVRVEAEQDVYARPQVILSITAGSKRQLEQFVSRNGRRLASRFIGVELRRQQQLLKQNHNAEAEQKIKDMFGAQMLVPADMIASKKGENFLWLSNNANSAMASICLYTICPGDFTAQRDSIMRRNIPGQWKGSFMQTARIDQTVQGRRGATTIRGLWQMHADAMGGPFVAYIPSQKSSPSSRTLVAEAFVFAPESKKRNIVRRLEAAILTLKTMKQSEPNTIKK